jgi:hypothetical protein
MTDTDELHNPTTSPGPLPSAGGSRGENSSINDNLPSSSPSGNTVLKVFAGVLGLIVLVVLYADIIGF